LSNERNFCSSGKVVADIGRVVVKGKDGKTMLVSDIGDVAVGSLNRSGVV
jgi:Cu/Ag efflux pump CusA